MSNAEGESKIHITDLAYLISLVLSYVSTEMGKLNNWKQVAQRLSSMRLREGSFFLPFLCKKRQLEPWDILLINLSKCP